MLIKLLRVVPQTVYNAPLDATAENAIYPRGILFKINARFSYRERTQISDDGSVRDTETVKSVILSVLAGLLRRKRSAT